MAATKTLALVGMREASICAARREQRRRLINSRWRGEKSGSAEQLARPGGLTHGQCQLKDSTAAIRLHLEKIATKVEQGSAEPGGLSLTQCQLKLVNDSTRVPAITKS